MTEVVILEVLTEIEEKEAETEVAIGTKIARENEIEKGIEIVVGIGTETEDGKKNGTEKGLTIAAEKENVVAPQVVVHQVAAQAVAQTKEKRNADLEVEVLRERNVVIVKKGKEGQKVKVLQSQDQGVENEKARNLKPGIKI